MQLSKKGAGTWTITFEVSVANARNSDVFIQAEDMNADTINLECQLDDSFNNASINGTTVQLSATNNHIPVNMPGIYRLNYTGSESNIYVRVCGLNDGFGSVTP